MEKLMNPHKQIIAIAELCGRKRSHVENGIPMEHVGGDIFNPLPNYLISLDACAEFERTLGGQLGLEYVERIEEAQAERGIPKRLALLWADPQMRCMAFLKLHGKWEE